MSKVNLEIDLRKIPNLAFDDLKAYYDTLFNVPTTSTRKEYYIWRITNKLQEMRFARSVKARQKGLLLWVLRRV